MPRRREVPKREILPDPKFGDVDLAKFMNVIMQGGKKAVAERIIYGALDFIEKKNPGKDPLEAFHMAIGNIKPMVEVKSRRVGGANYQVPVEVRPVRRMALAMRWLKEAAKKRGEKSMSLPVWCTTPFPAGRRVEKMKDARVPGRLSTSLCS
jgi:small subunit ribosomal protein S7